MTRVSLALVVRRLIDLAALAALATPMLARAAPQGDVWAAGFGSQDPPTPQYMQRVLEQLPPRPEFFLGPRWSGLQGSPRVVTWSFVPDGVVIPSVIGENQGQSSLFARLDAVFASQGGRATWVARVQESFDRWEQLTGIDFQRIQGVGVDWDDGASWGSFGSATRGDIRLAMKRLDGVGGVTVIASFPGNGDILLDRFETWETSNDQHLVLRNSLMWAMGIACGVDLSCPTDGTKLMEPLIAFNFDGPRQDDVRAMQRHYGDPNEIDDASANATSLGPISIGSGVQLGAPPAPPTGSNDPNVALLSIDADGEEDFFSFSVASPAVVTVTVTPIGSTYDVGPNNGGSCSGSTPFDALSVADLAVELLAGDGSTVLATGTSSGLGQAEVLSLVPLSGAGTFYVRVFESDAPSSPQGYALDVSVSTCTVDSDGDGTADCLDGCPLDPNKVSPGVCGCGVSDVDSDGDGTADCMDGCPADPNKIAPGQCGCGVLDTDTDGDGTADCNDLCPLDPLKIVAGFCGCGNPETDTDGDGAPDCADGCPTDPLKIAPGQCGCGVADIDTDGDGVADCNDGCPMDPFKTDPGICGCGVSDVDSDGDGVANCLDGCPNDPLKVAPGACGCGVPDVDSDGDGALDCNDGCPNDPGKVAPGLCGCGVADVDSDGDGTVDCLDGCPSDPLKIDPGVCGCGNLETDADFDGVVDCIDNCTGLANPTQTDGDGDGRGDACDNCPNHVNPDQADCDLDGQGDVCEIALGSEIDCDLNGVPDSCEPDCNFNGRVDACDILLGTSLDSNGDLVPDECQAPCPAIQNYCTGKVNSLGCTPAIGWSGTPSVAQSSGFDIVCTNTISDRSGQMFYGYAASFAPFQGGYLCIRPPFRRTGLQTSVGTPGCNGTYTFDFNAWMFSGNDPLLVPGINVFARWWMRDPQASFTTGFSDALTFTVCP